MSNGTRQIGAALCALAVIQAGAPARAEPIAPRCWEMRHLEAARVSELHTMLMAVTLRCHAAGIDVRSSYETFVRTQKHGLAQAEKDLRARYGEGKKRLGAGPYDQYLTALGNFYGAGRTDEMTCRSFEAVALALGHEHAAPALLPQIARQVVREPRLDAPVCTQTAQAQ